MSQFEKPIYYKDEEREEYFRSMFVSGIKNGLTGQALFSLAMMPELQEENFTIETSKLSDKVKDAIYQKEQINTAYKSRQNKNQNYPATMSVNFCYFLVVYDQGDLLSKMISSDDDQPFVAPPYQRIRTFDGQGKEKISVVFYDNANGEPFTYEQGLEAIKNNLAVDLSDNPILALSLSNLPNFIKPIHQNDVASQLRFLYKVDGRIQRLSELLYKERGINLVNSYPSIIPETTIKTNISDIMGIGQNMDSDFWAKVEAQRAAYAETHKDQLAANSDQYVTTVKSIWPDDGTRPEEQSSQQPTTAKKTGGMK